MGFVFKVCIPNTHRNFFDYTAGSDEPAIGSRILVPFRKKERVGIVVGQGPVENPNAAIKSIHQVLDNEPFITQNLLSLCHWVSNYYQSPLSEVLALALPKMIREGGLVADAPEIGYRLALPAEEACAKLPQNAPRQRALVAYLANHTIPMTKSALIRTGFKPAQLTALLENGLVVTAPLIDIPKAGIKGEPLPLNPDQVHALDTMRSQLDAFHCFLLQGVTGSGKTEVYLQLITTILARGQQVLVLVPEIGLTPQLLERFDARFHEKLVAIHSNLSDGERLKAWQAARTGQAKIIIGTRTAVFTPMANLGLVIIDEEHDASLKQMDGVRYSARDTALMRAFQSQIPIVLGSATPSLESLHNCLQGKYTRLTLTQKALNTHPLRYQVIDIRNQPLQQGLTENTLRVIEQHLNENNQVLVFINRRGFSPVLLCHQCGWIADCRACDSHLTLHQKRDRLICHHCGLMEKVPNHCVRCQARDLLPIGAGTQRIHEHLSSQFPKVSCLRIDRDEVGQKDALNEKLQHIHRGEAQLIVGTQMLAKGHHFPRLTLVVVVDADHGFYNQDFRALEHFGQLLTQVAGRAGRASLPGEVVIQTHFPQHPLLNTLIREGYDAFAHDLLSLRKDSLLPPYQYLAVIRAQSSAEPRVLRFLHTARDKLKPLAVEVLGPAPAPLARKAGQHRMQLLIKSPSRKKLQEALTQTRDWLTVSKVSQGVRWNVDVDPVDLS